LKVGISSLLFVNQTIDEAVRTSAELGASWFEIIFDIPHFPPEWDQRELKHIREILESYGLGVSVHASFWDVNPISHLRELREISLRRVKTSIDVCSELGGKITVVHFGRCSIPEVRALRERAKKNFSEFFRECAYYARERGVRVALENPGRDPRSYPGTFEEIESVIRENEGMGMTFDIGHANLFFRRRGERATGRRIADQIRKMRDIIIHFHLHDNLGRNDDHLPPGKGKIAFKPVLRSIREIGYSGAVILELWNPSDPVEFAKRGLGWAKKFMIGRSAR